MRRYRGLTEVVRNAPPFAFMLEANRILRPDRSAGPTLDAAQIVEGEPAFRNLLHCLSQRLLSLTAPQRCKVALVELPEGGEGASRGGEGEAVRGARRDPGFRHGARGDFIVHVDLRVLPVLHVSEWACPEANLLSRALLSLNLHFVGEKLASEEEAREGSIDYA